MKDNQMMYTVNAYGSTSNRGGNIPDTWDYVMATYATFAEAQKECNIRNGGAVYNTHRVVTHTKEYKG